jgi:hypothetical protein
MEESDRMNFKNFNPNLIPSIAKGYEEEFSKNPNIVGSSEIPMGLRATIIKKRNGLTLGPQMDLLSGKMTHRTLQKSKVMGLITKEINKTLGYMEIEANGKRFIELQNGNYMEFITEKEKFLLVEIESGKFLRMHLDIATSLYTIEIKTTAEPMKMWGDLAPYQLQQLNTYMRFNHNTFGFLLKCDLNFYKSKSKKWAYVWKHYFFLYPFNFNQELFEFTLNRLKNYFNYLDYEDNLYNIPCPEFLFECKNECQEYCPNPIEKVKMDSNDTCHHCGKEIRAGTTGIMRNDRMYHYTDGHRNQFKECVEACKRSFLEVRNEG